jgi:hypothetical protein
MLHMSSYTATLIDAVHFTIKEEEEEEEEGDINSNKLLLCLNNITAGLTTIKTLTSV